MRDLFFALPILFWTSALMASDIEFNRDVRPILSDKCFHCHGPDSATREADFRLDREEVAKGDRGGYFAIVPGSPAESEFVARIEAQDPGVVMPPPDSGRELSEAEREVLKQWVAEGAVFEPLWSFAPLQRPAPPDVQQTAWPRNGIDYFVLARLERENLQPSPEADPRTLVRRVTLDLTGLPPTPEEVDAYLRDPAPGKYEALVDRLLQSERYGEHMAVTWLDAARYADTDGYQNDGPRDMWRWRDWVIQAYNRNLPFDRFTIEQLAGDLLPDATLEQRIATGFNRNHRYNSEAGLVLEEFLLENAVDRVDTTSAVWMGLTMGCARCHDHKYDALTQEEYYQLVSFFDNVTESGRAVKFGNSEPWVVAPTPRQQEELDQLETEVRHAEEALQRAEGAIDESLSKWLATADQQTLARPFVSEGLTHHFPLDEVREEDVEIGAPRAIDDEDRLAVQFDGQSVLQFGAVGDVRGETRSSISFWMRASEAESGVVLSRQTKNTRRPGLVVELHLQRLRFSIITRWVAGVGSVETVDVVPTDRWLHVTLTNDGSQSARGMKIYIDGRPADTQILYNTNSNTGGTDRGAVLRVGGGVHGAPFRGDVDDVRFYDRTLFDDEILNLASSPSITRLAGLRSSDRNPRQQAALRNWYLEHAAPDNLQAVHRRFEAARGRQRAYWDGLPTTMVMEEHSSPNTTRVRLRGIYDQYGEAVTRGVPASLPPMADSMPRNRLGLAQWLVDESHPLTARVAVNRYWLKYFGTGLVKTAEDFGFQGELPSHPELLDWMATEFIQRRWDIKAMQKLIVTSATYRQSSRRSPRAQRIDPENRLLARGPRQRLSAHALRDQALFMSGLLVERIGGPSVSPYQPAGLWKELSNMVYQPSQGPDLYRRSLYTIWKRTVAPPSLATLDAADRESCILRPKRTNTPLQALTLLNETTFVEAARHLAMRMMLEGKESPIEFGFRVVTQRPPRPEERSVLQEAWQEYYRQFQERPQDAELLLQVGASPGDETLDPLQLAAFTALANVLLNLDEVVTKE